MSRRQEFEANPRAVWVANIPASTTEDEIRGIFSEYGVITRIDLPESSNGRKPYAFVHFDNADDADNAIEKLNGSRIGNLQIVVRRGSRDRKEDRPPRPSGDPPGRPRGLRDSSPPPRRGDFEEHPRPGRYESGYDRREPLPIRPPRGEFYCDYRRESRPPIDDEFYARRDPRRYPEDDRRAPPRYDEREEAYGAPRYRDNRRERDFSPPRYNERREMSPGDRSPLQKRFERSPQRFQEQSPKRFERSPPPPQRYPEREERFQERSPPPPPKREQRFERSQYSPEPFNDRRASERSPAEDFRPRDGRR